MKHAPDFKTHGEHDAWVTANADYFTVIAPAYRARARFEFETLYDAREKAREIVNTHRTVVNKSNVGGLPSRVLIYAVCGVYSCYVETISKKESENE